MGGKMLIVSFEEDEEEIFDTVLKVLQENEMIQFQHKCRNKNEIRYINLLIDIGQRIVKKCNQETELTYKEFEILRLLINKPKVIVPKEDIIIKVWGADAEADDNNVEAYISFLRKKLNFLGSEAKIKTIRKVGYRLEEKDD